jgi:hypothetical protein
MDELLDDEFPIDAADTADSPTNKERRERFRHGLFLPGNNLPGQGYISKQLNLFRRALEDEVLNTKGQIGVLDAALVNTAVEWARHGMRCAYWLEESYDTFKPSERVEHSAWVAKACDARDKAIKALDLSAEPSDFLDEIHESQ